ncbi:MAG: hypothetical protein JWR61_5287 [Ferruginibacter sp.]|uniref:PID-CTERM protein-sorting domain-containing protein n=1 Tax=Ferruginibacter sp. TaxID=1940288 RepID=UPI002659684E|nr:hypothetical protein [Ferruginibacter sp.]MDB5280332.1 hypothetical protein [Ferruginibacter sp.]
MKIKYRFWLISALFLVMSSLPATMLAQTDVLPPPDDCLPTDPSHQPDSPPCPVDGGISYLVAAGVVYGAKKVKDNRNKKAVQLT